jgi:hypothetical protein
MSGGDQGWQVGDLALCVSNEGFHPAFCLGRSIPTIGSISQVAQVSCDQQRRVRRLFKPNLLIPGGIWLLLESFPRLSFYSSNFRKIHPHTPDAEDTETIALLNGQPARKPELV